VIESPNALELNIDMLNSSAVKASQPALLAESFRSVSKILCSVVNLIGSGRGAAKRRRPPFFASSEADISRAKWQSNQLRIEIIRSISDRIWNERGSNHVDVGLLDDARRSHLVAFSNSACPRELQGYDLGESEPISRPKT
jgi:hypothetical protein